MDHCWSNSWSKIIIEKYAQFFLGTYEYNFVYQAICIAAINMLYYTLMSKTSKQ
jgi:hypothetical protein